MDGRNRRYPLWCLAHHEAGHCVAALAVGHDVNVASVEEKAGGGAHGGSFIYPGILDYAPGSEEQQVVVLLAGEIAEERLHGNIYRDKNWSPSIYVAERFWQYVVADLTTPEERTEYQQDVVLLSPFGSRSDRDKVSLLLSELCGDAASETELRQTLGRAADAANEILHLRWKVVEALAMELFAKRTLSGDAVRLLVDTHAGGLT